MGSNDLQNKDNKLQLIYNFRRKVMLQKQHYRCAGCGLKVTPSKLFNSELFLFDSLSLMYPYKFLCFLCAGEIE